MSKTIQDKFKIPKRLDESSTNIWNDVTELIEEYDPLDLSIAVADYLPKKYFTDILFEVAKDKNSHQYTRDTGHLKLVNSLSDFYSKFLNRQINPMLEIIVTSSGIEAIYISIMGHIDKDDEVIIIEPYFKFFESIVKIAGGKCKFIPLRLKRPKNSKTLLSSSDWILNTDELTKCFNEKTKLFILNNPNNPLGKVFSFKELTIIADLCKKWNVVCISDEVYEFHIYSPSKHIRISTLPGMWERTITICCPGKTFSLTGWETGVIYGAQNVLHNLQVQQNIVYTGNTPIQEAYARIYEDETEKLDTPLSIVQNIPKEFKKKRDNIVRILKDAGMEPIMPEGGFLILADWRSFSSKINWKKENDTEQEDIQFIKWMIKNLKLVGLPASGFYSQQNKKLGENYIRFSFNKKKESLESLENILKTAINK